MRIIPENLREAAVKFYSKTVEPYRKEGMKKEIMRLGRWGSCVDCPDSMGRKYGHFRDPSDIQIKKCENTERYDHWITEAFLNSL